MSINNVPGHPLVTAFAWLISGICYVACFFLLWGTILGAC
jgi:hypothetical protein